MTQRRGPAAQGARLWPALGILTVLTYNTWLLWRPLNGQTRSSFAGKAGEQ